MKPRLLYLIFVLVILFFIYDYYEYRQSQAWLAINGKKSVCTIDVIGKNVMCGFLQETDGIQIWTDKESSPFYGLKDGERFVVAYNPNNKNEYRILFEEPIVDNNFTNTCSKEVDFVWLSKNKVKFTYMVNNNLYDRIQKVYEDKYSFDGNFKFLVKYMKIDPEVAYIFLDSTSCSPTGRSINFHQ